MDTVVTGHRDVDPRHHTPRGIVHGGVWATAIESAATVGATEVVTERRHFTLARTTSPASSDRFGTAA